MTGHWYCSYCNDVVILPKPVGRWDAKRGVTCPVCHHNSCDWIPATPRTLTTERAAVLFHQLKEQLQ